jgi:hypothetical protein
MARQFQIPANLKPVQMFAPKTTNATLTSQVISLKNAHKAWIVSRIHPGRRSRDHADAQAGDLDRRRHQQGRPDRRHLGERRHRGDRYAGEADGRRILCRHQRCEEQAGVFEIDPTGSMSRTVTTASTHDRDLVAGDELRLRDGLSPAAYQQATPPSAILD